MTAISYARHRFPPDVIRHAVWLYLPFTSGFLSERGLDVSYEAVRRWVLKVQLHEKATRRIAADFLRAFAAAVPYKIRIVLTDNGSHFTEPTGDGWTPEDINAMRAQGVMFRCHSF